MELNADERTETREHSRPAIYAPAFLQKAATQQATCLLCCQFNPARLSAILQSDIRFPAWHGETDTVDTSGTHAGLVDPGRLAAVAVDCPSLARMRQDVSQFARDHRRCAFVSLRLFLLPDP